MAARFEWEPVDDGGQKVWRARAAGLQLAVYQYMGDTWFFTCHDLDIGARMLDARILEEAQAEAVLMCRNLLQFRLASYKKAVDALDYHLANEAGPKP